MKGGICVLVGALLVVFSLTMVAEAQRKNRIRGNQGRRSVGNPGTTIQQKRKGQPSLSDFNDGTSNTLRRDQRDVERNRRKSVGKPGNTIQRKRRRAGTSMYIDDASSNFLTGNQDRRARDQLDVDADLKSD